MTLERVESMVVWSCVLEQDVMESETCNRGNHFIVTKEGWRGRGKEREGESWQHNTLEPSKVGFQ